MVPHVLKYEHAQLVGQALENNEELHGKFCARFVPVLNNSLIASEQSWANGMTTLFVR
jgi:hypothetical protein